MSKSKTWFQRNWLSRRLKNLSLRRQKITKRNHVIELMEAKAD
jgi:hypothetical protein